MWLFGPTQTGTYSPRMQCKCAHGPSRPLLRHPTAPLFVAVVVPCRRRRRFCPSPDFGSCCVAACLHDKQFWGLWKKENSWPTFHPQQSGTHHAIQRHWTVIANGSENGEECARHQCKTRTSTNHNGNRPQQGAQFQREAVRQSACILIIKKHIDGGFFNKKKKHQSPSPPYLPFLHFARVMEWEEHAVRSVHRQCHHVEAYCPRGNLHHARDLRPPWRQLAGNSRDKDAQQIANVHEDVEEGGHHLLGEMKEKFVQNCNQNLTKTCLNHFAIQINVFVFNFKNVQFAMK